MANDQGPRTGEQWLDIHLERSGKTRKQLAQFLSEHNVTAVFELTDDDFEEHVLEYPPERRGLHLHGVNFNTIEFRTWPADAIHRFSEQFGFVKVGVIIKNSLGGKLLGKAGPNGCKTD